MAGQWGTGGSRAGSLSMEGAPLMAGQGPAPEGEPPSSIAASATAAHEESSLLTLARRNTRNRSLRNKKAMDLQDVMATSRHPSMDSLVDPQHLHPTGFGAAHRRSPSLRRGHSPSLQRSPSPRRRHHLHHDIGFSDTVSNVVEIVKHEHQRQYSNKHRFRGSFDPGSWSASTSPARSPSPTGRHAHAPLRSRKQPGYGTTSLCQRSRSPSPTLPTTHTAIGALCSAVAGMNSSTPHTGGPLGCGMFGAIPVPHTDPVPRGTVQHSHPVLVGRRGQGRRLPPTPCKPSTLQLRPQPINFPKLNASPTHMQVHTTHNTPHGHQHNLSFTRDNLRGDTISLPHHASRELLREGTPRELHRDLPPPVGSIAPVGAPLSFEQAVAMGRGGRMLPSPVPNGYKPKPTSRSRHSDSDDDDWC